MNAPFSLFLIGLGGSIAFLIAANYLLYKKRKRTAFKKIIQSVQLTSPATQTQSTILPKIVHKYLNNTVGEIQTSHNIAKITISGQFRRNEKSGWQSVHAKAVYNCKYPSFAWFGYFGNPIFHTLTALLALNNNKGQSSLLFLHSIPLLHSSGSETITSLLSRYLTEAVCFPFVFTQSNLFEWNKLSNNSASLKLTHLQQEIHAIATFNEKNLLTHITITDRFRDFKGFFEKQTFHAEYANYQKFQNITIPTSINYSWETETGTFPYAKFIVSNVTFS